MIVTLVALGVALASAVTLVVLFWRKAPTLLTLDPGKLPKHQVEQKKRRILEARMDRRLKVVEGAVLRTVRPVWGTATGAFSRIVDRVHRTVATTAPVPEPTVETAISLGDAIAACERSAASGRWDELETAAMAVIKLDPKNLEAYRYLGQSALNRAQYDEAREVYAYLVKRGYADASVYGALGTIATALRDPKAAEESYAKAITLEPENPEHRLNLAEARLILDRSLQAFEAAADALRIAPNNPRVIDAYVRIALTAGKPGFAEDGLRRLAEVNPENAKIAEYRAQIQSEIGSLPKRRRR